jgi:hypothetical protein
VAIWLFCTDFARPPQSLGADSGEGKRSSLGPPRELGTCPTPELFRSRCLAFGPLGQILVQPLFELIDGGAEVVVARQQKVDAVEVFPTREAMGEVVAGVHVSDILSRTIR